MKIVSSNDNFIIYPDVLDTFDALPTDYYDIRFSKMTGFSLVKRPSFIINEPKIYGHLDEKADKILNSYSLSNRNFGTIISGESGMGKSVLMRLTCIKAIERGIPVINCAEYDQGLEDFISSIDQRVLVVFDEFEKKFKEDRESGFDPQEKFLSLLDGVDGGEKLFIITCNRTSALNDYMLNRPGRFYYHFKLTHPSSEEIEEYLKDNLTSKNAEKDINKILSLTDFYPFTFDNLRALTVELNNGYNLEESLTDLNIIFNKPDNFDVKIIFVDNTISVINDYTIEWSRKYNTIWDRNIGHIDGDDCGVQFKLNDLKYERNSKLFYIDDGFTYINDYGDEVNLEEDNIKEIKKIEFTKAKQKISGFGSIFNMF